MVHPFPLPKSISLNLEEIFRKAALRKILASFGALALTAFLLTLYSGDWKKRSPLSFLPGFGTNPPLVMQGGDPYIRALMRTITASEANDSRPYSVLYGGEHTWDLSRHPDQCVTIVAGPNVGNCTTAAGRYQFITTTWEKMATRYHPSPSGFLLWKFYSFEPEYQDAVVYHWLSDEKAWRINISQQLRQGKLNTVLKELSPTWTSLGYGIEDNSMTGYLPSVYERMLREELGRT